MAFILNIETATPYCSVALSDGSEILAGKESGEPNIHSSHLQVFIAGVLSEAGVSPAAIDAVSVSIGPGSYTGLRIGLSAAKGLCFALDRPLITLKTHLIMARGLASETRSDVPGLLYCPMIDARRMEVYYALYDHSLNEIQAPAAAVIDGHFPESVAPGTAVVFGGDGCKKCIPFLEKRSGAIISMQTIPRAVHMASLSAECYGKSAFSDYIYTEPFYLKDFIAAPPSVKGLR